MAIACKNPTDLSKLVKGLKKLEGIDTLIRVSVDPSGEYIVSGAGELHLEITLKDWISPPKVFFRETVTETSNQLYLQITKHNRLFTVAKPLSNEQIQNLETNCLHSWNLSDIKKIWAFGANTQEHNILSNSIKGVQNSGLNEIKDSVIAAFEWVTKEGILAREPIRGAQFEFMDAVLHS